MLVAFSGYRPTAYRYWSQNRVYMTVAAVRTVFFFVGFIPHMNLGFFLLYLF